jgi:uncharacterized SAM-binding protein YcdF (DUF218 family)
VKRRSRAWLVAVVLVVAATGPLVWAVSGLGGWLVVADPLERASAAVVLSGGVPFRAIEAAAIYRGGWVREVWTTRSSNPAEEAVLARLKLDLDFRDESSNRLILERLGVSPGDIRVLAPGGRNTAEELKIVARELLRTGGDRVILVTSKSHSRRVRATWRAVVGTIPRGAVRHAESDPFDGTRWWERTSDALAVSREVFGLMNVWAGFPIHPDQTKVATREAR